MCPYTALPCTACITQILVFYSTFSGIHKARKCSKMTESHPPKLKQHSSHSEIFLTVNFKQLHQLECKKIILYDKNVSDGFRK